MSEGWFGRGGGNGCWRRRRRQRGLGLCKSRARWVSAWYRGEASFSGSCLCASTVGDSLGDSTHPSEETRRWFPSHSNFRTTLRFPSVSRTVLSPESSIPRRYSLTRPKSPGRVFLALWSLLLPPFHFLHPLLRAPLGSLLEGGVLRNLRGVVD